MKRRLTFAVVLVLTGTAPAAAQSLFAARGLGVPLAATDARSRILGGMGVGLLGLNSSLVNPADAAGLLRRGISAGVMSSPRTMSYNGVQADVGATRFPLLTVLYPLSSRVVATVGYGGFLDQSWAVQATRVEAVGADTLEVTDVTNSTGGIAQVRLGAAYSLTDRFALGLALGVYTGSQNVLFSREFTDTTVAGIQDFQTRVGWSYHAPLASVGFRWDPSSILRVGGSITVPGKLDATVKQGAVQDRTVAMPVQVAAGGSAYLSSQLLAAVSGRWSGWSAAAGDLATAALPAGVDAARNTWEVGAGLEYESAERRSRAVPLRLGFNYAQLPFVFGEGAPSEWAGAAGIGLRIGQSRTNPLAVMDLTVEKGQRGTAATNGLTEDFWRVTLSMSLFGR